MRTYGRRSMFYCGKFSCPCAQGRKIPAKSLNSTLRRDECRMHPWRSRHSCLTPVIYATMGRLPTIEKKLVRASYITGVRHTWHERQGWMGHLSRFSVLLRDVAITFPPCIRVQQFFDNKIWTFYHMRAWMGWINYVLRNFYCSPFKFRSHNAFGNFSFILLILWIRGSTVIF